jgi:hypothetical protein
VYIEGMVMCVGCPIAIRIEEKGEGFENGNLFWRSGLAFNLNHSLQSLTRLKISRITYKTYELKIKGQNTDFDYAKI